MHIDIDWVSHKVLVDERYVWTPERAIQFANDLIGQAKKVADYRDRIAKRERLYAQLDEARTRVRDLENKIAEV